MHFDSQHRSLMIQQLYMCGTNEKFAEQVRVQSCTIGSLVLRSRRLQHST